MAVDFFGIICLQIIYLLKTNHENTTKCDNCSSHSCIIIKNSAYFVWQMSYSFDRLAHVETTWTAVLWIKPHSWMWLQTQKYHIQNLGKKRGATKTLPTMMGAHPTPSGRESISLFWTFNRLTNHLRIHSGEGPLQYDLLKYMSQIFAQHI